jgi:hypothetical protein
MWSFRSADEELGYSIATSPPPTVFAMPIVYMCCQVVLGLHIVRGDNICVVGEIDEEMDQRLGNNQ